MSTATLYVRMDKNYYQYLQEWAEDNHISLAALVNLLLTELIDNEH